MSRKAPTAGDELEPLLTVQQLAEYLQVPEGTIYKWRYRRTGPPAMKVGIHLRWRKSDVDEWLESLKLDE